MHKLQTPLTGFAGLKAHWKDDLKAGFSISLIALPLSLGIALASGFPPIAGLLSAIVGGLLVSRINGSFATITGPAAGLIVVNLSAIEVLGAGDNVAGYHYTLAAIFMAGIFIFLFGLIKAGKLGDFFPTSAVHGMLAAIGVIIIIKQIFVAIGVSAHGHELYEVAEELPSGFLHANPEVALIALVSLIVLIVHPFIKYKFVQLIPAPMWVLLSAIPLELGMDWEHAHEVAVLGMHHKVGPQLLVHLPANLLDGIVMPDFGMIATSGFWIAVISIAMVTAIESLLSAVAIDTLDPFKRKSNLNKDLGAMGIGSSISSFMGGLPMITEIVRSSANVSNGAKTQWANFFHAVILLIFIILLRPLIELIPLSALAAMLVFTGYKLAAPKEFKHVYEIGKSELFIFVVTMIVVLATDLLIGIGVGIIVNMILNITKGASIGSLFKANVEEVIEKDKVTLKLKGAFTFSNYLGLKSKILKHADKSIALDLSEATMLDHSVVHHLHDFVHDQEAKGLEFYFENDGHLNQVSEHPLAERNVNAPKLQIEISQRDRDLEAFAMANKWDFFPGRAFTDKWSSYAILLGRRVEKESNIIHFQKNRNNITVSDLEVTSGAYTTDSTDEITVMRMELTKEIPVFSLQQESFLDQLLVKIVDDINFPNYPKFSDSFILKGEFENEVRELFTDDLLQFLETYDKYAIDSDGDSIAIYGDGILKPAEITAMVEFGNALMRFL
tara:strand:- start:9969 stop:12149 length:2181 start_codon:yes stop_codon:yes gene_type:complete